MEKEVVQKLIEYVESSKDFILEQAPDVINEMLRYYFITNLCGCFIFSLIFILCIATCTYCYINPVYDKYNNRETASTLLCWLPLLVSFMFLMQACDNIDEVIKITVAPKYFVLQKLVSLKS